jgi:hypothetical protein
MKKAKPDSRPFAGVTFTEELTARKSNGDTVLVRYRRVPVRDGYDIEAAIISKTPAAVISGLGRGPEAVEEDAR